MQQHATVAGAKAPAPVGGTTYSVTTLSRSSSSLVTVIEIGTETAVFFAIPYRSETAILCLSVDGFGNGAALVF